MGTKEGHRPCRRATRARGRRTAKRKAQGLRGVLPRHPAIACADLSARMSGGMAAARKEAYRLRVDLVAGIAGCTSCGERKAIADFHQSKGRPNSTCKSCHHERWGKHITPSRQREIDAAAERARQRADRLISCPACDRTTRDAEWPRCPSGCRRKTCCAPRRGHRAIEIAATGLRTCPRCNTAKPLNMFTADRRRPGGRGSYCAECFRTIVKISRHSSKDARKHMSTRRAARIAMLDDGTLTSGVIEALLNNATSCPYCRVALTADSKSIDHLDPISRGGSHSISNVTVCCRACNTKKNSTSFLDWMQSLPPDVAADALAMFRRIAGADPRQLKGIVKVDAKKNRRRPKHQQIRSSGRFRCVATDGGSVGPQGPVLHQVGPRGAVQFCGRGGISGVAG